MLLNTTSNKYIKNYVSNVINKGINTFLAQYMCKDTDKYIILNTSIITNCDNELSAEIKYIMNIIGINVSNETDLFGVLIDRDMLLRVDIEHKLSSMIDTLKIKYKSSKLNCLHKTRDHKQKFPGINLIRQIFRCNGYHLKPVVYSRGYCKHNGKKITERHFKIVRCDLHTYIFK